MSPTLSERAEKLDDYRAFMAHASSTSKVIVSPHDLRAAVVVAELFRHSRHQIDIVTGTLEPHIYCEGACVRAAVGFLTDYPAARIRILSEQIVPDDHPFLVETRHAADRRVNCLVVPQELQELYAYQFVLGDGHHFRFQPSRDSNEALVRFGDEPNGNKLQTAFDALYNEVQRRAAPAAPAVSAHNRAAALNFA